MSLLDDLEPHVDKFARARAARAEELREREERRREEERRAVHRRQRQAFRNLEEAREAVRHYEAGLRWFVTALVCFIVMVLGGALVPMVALALTMSIVGGVGAGLSTLGGVVWICVGLEHGHNPYPELREAQRDYDAALDVED